jgi:hypothetical protein
MNHLQKITTLAKKLKKVHPNTKWTELIKKAARQLRGEGKGKAPVKAKAKTTKGKVGSVGIMPEIIQRSFMKDVLKKKGISIDAAVTNPELKSIFKKMSTRKVPTAAAINTMQKKGMSAAAILTKLKS